MWYYFFMENVMTDSTETLIQKKPIGRKALYFIVFGVAFLAFSIAVIPDVILSKGLFIYYGDYNVQQIPFYLHVHEALKNGKFFYDFGTDLGGSFVGCYSFYLLGSPFFWLTLPFETSVVPYLMPWLSALKYAVMATTAFAYLKRHVKSDAGAFIGAFLFAFSGYQGAVLVYNHFHDVVAFFPLYLLLFERLVEKKKAVGFSLMTTFMVCLNYYFFVGIAVFLVIYFICMYVCEPGKISEKIWSALRAFVAGLTGILLSGIYFLPSIAYTLDNSRLSQTLLGYDLVAYKEPTMIWAIIKNVVMLPDLSGLNSMLNQTYSRVSGIGAYIPLFSIAGVVAYLRFHREKNRYKRLLYTCLVFVLVPGLNALFSALNAEYYARWYFMPVLVMAMMTASSIEDREECNSELWYGTRVVAVLTVAIIFISVLPAKTEEGELTVLGALKNFDQLICEISFSLVMLVVLFVYMTRFSKKSTKASVIFVMFGVIATTATMLIEGMLLCNQERKEPFLKQAVFGESPLENDGTFYRIETDEDFYNYNMIWDDTHAITSFISTIPGATFDFYSAMEVPRKVTTHPYTTRIGLRALLSGKYFLTNNERSIEHIGHIEDMSELKDYEKIGENGGFNIYENKNYVPMGIGFDTYITETEFEESGAAKWVKDRMLMKFIILSDEVAEQFADVLENAEISGMNNITLFEFRKDVTARREMTADTFETTHKGFSATTSFDSERLIFFSVPYEKGFTASIDGVEAPIYKVDYGFMALRVPEGEHDIVFSFVPTYYKEGMIMSVFGMALFILILLKNILTRRHDCVKLG